MRQTLRLFALLLRGYVRDRVALFFSLIVPLMLMVIFGYLNLGDFGRVTLAIDDQAKNPSSAQLVQILKGIATFQLTELPTDQALTKLRRTELDMLIVIPSDFVIAPARPAQTVPQIVVYGDDARPQQVTVGRQIVAQVIDRLSFAVTQTAPVIGLKEETVQGVRLRYVDFLVPGSWASTSCSSRSSRSPSPWWPTSNEASCGGSWRRLFASPTFSPRTC